MTTETITVKCPRCCVCGEETVVDLPHDKFVRWQAGEHVQNAFPDMPADEREMLITGTHPACWCKLFLSGKFDDEM